MHDFGFLRFDPAQLQFMKSGRIEMEPAAARVGLEVRVVGNDSGEKVTALPNCKPARRSEESSLHGGFIQQPCVCLLMPLTSHLPMQLSILSGTLARLDRDAPQYSHKGFNDFNTCAGRPLGIS